MREKTMNESLRLKTNTEQLQETLINTLQSQLEDRAYIIDALRKQLAVSAPIVTKTKYPSMIDISDLTDEIDVLEHTVDALKDELKVLTRINSLQVESIVQLASEAKQHELDMRALRDTNGKLVADNTSLSQSVSIGNATIERLDRVSK